jgi:hypothetical protein
VEFKEKTGNICTVFTYPTEMALAPESAAIAVRRRSDICRWSYQNYPRDGAIGRFASHSLAILTCLPTAGAAKWWRLWRRLCIKVSLALQPDLDDEEMEKRQ